MHFLVQRQRGLLHVGQAVALQRRDRRRHPQQLGGALDQALAITRRHPAGRIQLGQQFADAAMGITQHRPAQRQRLDHGAPERLRLVGQLQHQRRDRDRCRGCRRAAATSPPATRARARGSARAARPHKPRDRARSRPAAAGAPSMPRAAGRPATRSHRDGPSDACRAPAGSAAARRRAAEIRRKKPSARHHPGDGHRERRPDRCRAGITCTRAGSSQR